MTSNRDPYRRLLQPIRTWPLAKIHPQTSPTAGHRAMRSARRSGHGSPFLAIAPELSVHVWTAARKIARNEFYLSIPSRKRDASMKFYRLYSGDDGRSHFEQLDSSQSSEFFNATRPANGLLFRNDFVPHIVNWHGAPRRRWVITLSGTVDIGVGDGTRMTFGPGDVLLAEDMTGQGHTATPRNWVRAYVNVE